MGNGLGSESLNVECCDTQWPACLQWE